MMTGIFRGARHGQADEEIFGKVYDRRVVARIIPFILPYKHLAVVATLAMLVYAVSLQAIPWLIKIGIDDHVVNKDYSGLAWLFALFMGITLVNWGANYVQQVVMAKVAEGILYSLRRAMFSHLQRLSLRFHDRTEVGRIMSRVQGDTSQLQQFMSLVVMTLGDLLSLVFIVVAMLILNVKLGLIAMSVLPVLVVVTWLWQPYAMKAFIRVRTTIAIVNGALNENITGVRVVQSMDRQGRNLEIFNGKTHDYLSAELGASRIAASLLPPLDLLNVVAIGLVLFFGSRMISSAQEIGTLIALVMYIQRFFDPIRSLTTQYTQFQRAMASGARIFELLDTDPDLVDTPNAKVLPTLKGEIDFQDVSFGYIPGEDILKGVNLHIKPGETVAVVGPTGAGKTTLISLLSRFYDVERGRGAILVDGHDIRDVTRRSLVSQISMVLQEPFLFSGTVRENIKYSHQAVTDEQMMEAARAVGAHEFIVRLEKGYDTLLEERGGNLSVGQRQLLSFARAIVADPRILILDEATANIDSFTEMLIQRALKSLLHGRTAVVIAHRLSTVRNADKIIVVNNGEIAEVGTHRQLIDHEGLYAHLYQMNYAAFEAALPPAVNGDDNGSARSEKGFAKSKSHAGNGKANRHADANGDSPDAAPSRRSAPSPG